MHSSTWSVLWGRHQSTRGRGKWEVCKQQESRYENTFQPDPARDNKGWDEILFKICNLASGSGDRPEFVRSLSKWDLRGAAICEVLKAEEVWSCSKLLFRVLGFISADFWHRYTQSRTHTGCSQCAFKPRRHSRDSPVDSSHLELLWTCRRCHGLMSRVCFYPSNSRN